MDKLPSIDSLSTFIHHKKPHKFCFVGLKCQKCRNIRAFLWVKSGLLILVRVKDLTFSISGCHYRILRPSTDPMTDPMKKPMTDVMSVTVPEIFSGTGTGTYFR